MDELNAGLGGDDHETVENAVIGADAQVGPGASADCVPDVPEPRHVAMPGMVGPVSHRDPHPVYSFEDFVAGKSAVLHLPEPNAGGLSMDVPVVSAGGPSAGGAVSEVSSAFDGCAPALGPSGPGGVAGGIGRAHASVYLSFGVLGGVFHRGEYVDEVRLGGVPLVVGRRDVLAGQYPDIDLASYWPADRLISRRHMRVYVGSDGAVYAEDLCGRGSTSVNGVPLGCDRVELHSGDEVRVSSVPFVVSVR